MHSTRNGLATSCRTILQGIAPRPPDWILAYATVFAIALVVGMMVDLIVLKWLETGKTQLVFTTAGVTWLAGWGAVTQQYILD